MNKEERARRLSDCVTLVSSLIERLKPIEVILSVVQEVNLLDSVKNE